VKHGLFCMLAIGLTASASALAAGNDELWEVSAKMDMPGMPFAMPGQTTRVCMKKGNEMDPNIAVPKNQDQDCKMSDVKVTGNKSSWNMECKGANPMTGSGEMTYANGTYNGSMKMHTGDGDMTMAYAGKRIGTCQAK